MGFGNFMRRAGGAIGGAAGRVTAGGGARGARRTVKPAAPAEQRYTTMPVKETKRMGGFKARLRSSIFK